MPPHYVCSGNGTGCVQVYHTTAATKGGRGGGAPPNKNFAPLNSSACPPKLPLPLRHFEDRGFFYWISTENLEKNRPSWRDDLFFFFGDQQKMRRKCDQFGAMTFFFEINQPKNFGPPRKKFCPPIEQRSRCGTVSHP